MKILLFLLAGTLPLLPVGVAYVGYAIDRRRNHRTLKRMSQSTKQQIWTNIVIEDERRRFRAMR